MRVSWSGGAAVAAVSVGALVAAGVSVGVLQLTTGFIHGSPASAGVPAPTVRVAGEHHGRLPWKGHATVNVRQGTIRQVELTAAGASRPVAGSVNSSGSRWRAASPRLLPDTRYVARITVADEASQLRTVIRHFRTPAASRYLAALLSPNGETVGVGEPISVHFYRPVPDSMRAAVERHLEVSTSPSTYGAWHWFDDEDLHWRPKHYWKPGTDVRLHMDISHLYFGHGIWGQAGEHEIHFHVGDAIISKVSVPDHEMKVYDNGRLLRTIPISAGSDQYPTMGGIHITLGKSQSVIMDSATVGIPKGSPGYYYETVYWDVRISDSGAYVHAAPWSLADQGNTNVSHGCVNVSPANAIWFYHLSHGYGDIVDVYDPQRGPSPTDPGTMDWNMTWQQWLAGDALAHHDGHRGKRH